MNKTIWVLLARLTQLDKHIVIQIRRGEDDLFDVLSEVAYLVDLFLVNPRVIVHIQVQQLWAQYLDQILLRDDLIWQFLS